LRRLAISLLALLTIVSGVSMLSSSASASTPDDPATTDEVQPVVESTAEGDGESVGDVAAVDVLQVSGFIDEILVDEITSSIERAADDGSQALLLQVNSKGTVVSDADVEELLTAVAEASIPVGVWVGPSGARFYGPAAQILAVADVTGMAPGARVGYLGPPLTVDGSEADLGIAGDRLRNDSVGLSDARSLSVFKQRIDDEGIPTVANMVQALDGYTEGDVTLITTEVVVLDDGSTRFDTIATVRFFKLGLVDQLFHTVASPPVAYLLLLIGLALLVFEFFTAGVGIAGAVGAVATVLAFSGLTVLPTRTWAVGLLMLAILAFAIDVQVGIPRFWTGIGIVLTIVGSWYLFESLPGTTVRPSWIVLIAGVGGMMLTFIVGMPSMVRTRFATPTIGREWMIGEEGTVVDDVDPDGVVEVGAARWRAHTNRATPVRVGETIRVAAIDGVTLEVEPLEGAAQDYRERRAAKKTDAPALESDA
jgi:membrane-bound serine protease (ClpP class)